MYELNSYLLRSKVNMDYIPKINVTHNGLWKCTAKQVDLNFEWVTNVLKIQG